LRTQLYDHPPPLSTRSFFARASAVLGYDIASLCLNEPAKLSTTAFSQPAIMVTQLATACCSPDLVACPAGLAPVLKEAAEVTKNDCHPAATVTHVAGFSLGEYAALVFAGAISFEDGVRLIQLRAEAMEQACAEAPGGMVTVSILPLQTPIYVYFALYT